MVDRLPREIGPVPEPPAIVAEESAAPADEERSASPADQVEEPAKVMRIGRMISRLLDEVKEAGLDEASRARLSEIYDSSIRELKGGVSDELAAELARITRPFNAESTPSEPELRVAQAQLVGWLEGLFQGIQTALVAQQVAAQTQLERIKRPLPPREHPQAGGLYL